MRIGEMVRRGGGPVMRITDVFHDMVRCVMIDAHGRISTRFCYNHELTPLWLSLQPRTLWPDPGQLDLVEIEREQRDIAAARKDRARSAKKSRRSLKIKGRSNASA